VSGTGPSESPWTPGPPEPESLAPIALDLAFRLETEAGDPLPPSLDPLLRRGGFLTGAGAEALWQRWLGHWLAELAAELPEPWRVGAYSLGLQLSDDASLEALNGQWRQRPEPTDVLAFAALDPDALGGMPPAPASPQDWEELESEPEPLELGDIVISLETAARQADRADGDLERELLFLASHGLLHLLGWDHPDEASLAAMLARQEALISGLSAMGAPQS
jgi:probable rRNA maturation factor